MSGGTVADRHVHPATVPLRFLKEAPSTLLGLPAAFAYVSDVGWTAVLAFAAFAAAIAFLFHWIRWRRFRYGLGESEIVIESGLFQRTRRSIPFARVQDVDIERGPLQRLFGLAKLRIETGGSGKDEGLLDSVTMAEADRVRAIVRSALSGLASPSAPAAEAQAPVRLIFAMDLARVFLSGLFNFSLIWIAGLFALLQAFDDWLPFDPYDPGRWVGLAGDRVADRFSAGAILMVLSVALVLGILTGIVRTISRDYGFTLSIEGAERFRRERGLFTRTEAVIPVSRVQLARVQTGPLRRTLGWHQIFFQTLSAAREGGGHQSMAPMARDAEVDAVLAEQRGMYAPAHATLAMVSSRHIVRALLSSAAPPIAAILVAAAISPLAWPLLAALPFIVVPALLERRFHLYALRDDFLFVARGVWRQQLWIVPVAKVQSVRLSRNFLQRRLGLATLSIDTAGAPMVNAPRIIDLREDKARALATQLTAAQLSGRKSGTDR